MQASETEAVMHEIQDQEGRAFEVQHKSLVQLQGDDAALRDPTSLEYARQVLYEKRVQEKERAAHDFDNLTYEQTLEAEAAAKFRPAAKSDFASYEHDLEALRKEEHQKAMFLEHEGVSPQKAHSALSGQQSKEDRAYAKLVLARDVAAGKVVLEERSVDQYQSMSRFAALFRPMNPDETDALQAQKGPKEKVRLPFTGESYVDRMTRKREERAAAELAARPPSYMAMGGALLYATSIGLLVSLGRCVLNCRQNASDCVESTDNCIAWVQCRRKGGVHGKHCMCGCRFIYPEDVTYPAWTDKKTEPLSWDIVFDCS